MRPRRPNILKNTQKEDAYAYCTYCRKDFPIAIASSGKFDVSRHKSGPSHVGFEKNQRKMW